MPATLKTRNAEARYNYLDILKELLCVPALRVFQSVLLENRKCFDLCWLDTWPIGLVLRSKMCGLVFPRNEKVGLYLHVYAVVRKSSHVHAVKSYRDLTVSGKPLYAACCVLPGLITTRNNGIVRRDMIKLTMRNRKRERPSRR